MDRPSVRFPWRMYLVRASELCTPWVLGTVLAVWFWLPLLQGGGFIGGDVYNYFLPLKKPYADGLKLGELRFWHPGVGNGVSVLGESQTGMFYPFHLLAYRWLEVVPAFNAVFFLHYTLAFVFLHHLARGRGLGAAPSLLAAVVYVYSWFPPRACLEWAITTGAWTPLELHCTFRWLETGRRHFGWTLVFTLFVQLLAGHFQLAWVGIVLIVASAVLFPLPRIAFRTCLARRGGVLLFLGVGMLLAAPQLLPTWELKTRSKRDETDFSRQVAYGRVPPAYLLQIVAPLLVYAAPDDWLKKAGGDSNRIEAHLYFGVAPLLLIGAALFTMRFWRQGGYWLLGSLSGIFLATGIPFLFLRYVPGFSFFRYPGRYGLIAAVFGSLTAGVALQAFSPRSRWGRLGLLILISVLALADYRWVAGAVGYAVIQKPPAFSFIDSSAVFKRLRSGDRILAPDGNTLSLSGAACVPPYIGLEPALYHSFWDATPDVFKGKTPINPQILDVLHRTGVTHLLTEEPLPEDWPATLLWSGFDPFLHRRWGRGANQPLHLYRFEEGAGRVRLGLPPYSPCELTVGVDRFVVDLPAGRGGDRLQLTEWALPGWSASVNDAPLPLLADDAFLAVEVPTNAERITFRYTPIAFRLGCIIMAATIVGCIGVEVLRRRADRAIVRRSGDRPTQ